MENTSALPSPFSFNCCGPKTFASQLGAPGYLYICTSAHLANHSSAVQWSKALDLSACLPGSYPILSSPVLSCPVLLHFENSRSWPCHAVCSRRVQHLIWTNEVSIKTTGQKEAGIQFLPPKQCQSAQTESRSGVKSRQVKSSCSHSSDVQITPENKKTSKMKMRREPVETTTPSHAIPSQPIPPATCRLIVSVVVPWIC